jgi:hypothetical protein
VYNPLLLSVVDGFEQRFEDVTLGSLEREKEREYVK